MNKFFTDLKILYNNYFHFFDSEVTIEGRVKNIRASKNIIFLELKDGTILEPVQIVIKNNVPNFVELSKLPIASAIRIVGTVIKSSKDKQLFEIAAKAVGILAIASNDYPLQKKEHGFEFLRENAHLRSNTNYFESVFRLRNAIMFSIHKHFQELDYLYLHTPIITTSDAEGAGEGFLVKTDSNEEFFASSNPAMLSVSGQLTGEAFAMAFKKIYTFGPTFRAEKSNTIRHLSEFWMIEPEVSFADLEKAIDVSFEMLTYVFRHILKYCQSELKYLSEKNNIDLVQRLEKLVGSSYKVINYSEAIKILQEAAKTTNFVNNKIEFGLDLNIEHEKYLCEKHFDCPIYIINYPKSFKAFYMKLNKDKKTVASFDMIVPGVGELIGGSERETNIEIIKMRAKEQGLNIDSLQWYLDLRKYGYYKSAGFGLGLERLVMYVTGVGNIRDTIPFPRAYGKINF